MLENADGPFLRCQVTSTTGHDPAFFWCSWDGWGK